MCVKLNGVQCGKLAGPGSSMCYMHQRVVERREEKARIKQQQTQNYPLYREVVLRVVRNNPNQNVGVIDQFLREAQDQNQIRRAQRIRLFRVFMDALARVRNAQLPVLPELQAFAQDMQNVHRKVVTDNTNDQTEKLLAVTVPAEQKTLKEIKVLFGKSRKVMEDVEHWYSLTMCRKEADCLYKRTLDGLWALIKTSEHKEELCKRLKEELREAVGMCCEGHLSRLCNVLVGFDDAFTTVVSRGEILQQKMAAIAALEVTDRTKKMRAKKVLRELEIPAEEHAAWLDAF